MQQGITAALRQTGKILDAWLPLKIQYDRLPGLSVGIVYKGRLVYARSFGVADLATKTPATPTTCYRIASISKMFTAVAVMQLVERGALRLDDEVHAHLPWFQTKKSNEDTSHVTIRQLLSHTAGVMRDGTTPYWEHGSFPTAKVLRASIGNRTRVFENLTRFKYSNFGFAILGQVIEKVSGLPYEQYMMKHIIQPLGMTHTSADLTTENAAWLANGYSRSMPGIPNRTLINHVPTLAFAPAAGFLSNVVDLAKFISLFSLCAPLRSTQKTHQKQIINRESKKEMLREHLRVIGNGMDIEDDCSYGLGISMYSVQHKKLIGHGGGFPGFITQVRVDMEKEIGVITLSNANTDSACYINTGIFETLFRLIDEKDKYFGGKTLQRQQLYEGAYRSRWWDQVVVGTGARLIAFDPETCSPLKYGTLLRPKAKHRFVMEPASAFETPGEDARFVVPSGAKQATQLILGAEPLDRLNYTTTGTSK